MLKIKIFTFFSVVLLIGFFFYFGFSQYLNLEYVMDKKKELNLFYKNYPIFFISSFFVFYVLCAVLNIPGAAFLTLTSGFLFGFFLGSIVASFAATIGAICSFLVSRFLLKDFVQKKFKSKLQTINQGFTNDGVFYLLSLRLIPIFPFFVVNVFMGLTPISVKQFFVGSFFGMLPAVFVYVNAGSRLSSVKSLDTIFSPLLVLSFLMLACLPWIMKFILKWIAKHYTKSF